MTTAELHLAAWFACEHCGRTTYLHCLSGDRLLTLDVNPIATEGGVLIPDRVVCGHCGAAHETVAEESAETDNP